MQKQKRVSGSTIFHSQMLTTIRSTVLLNRDDIPTSLLKARTRGYEGWMHPNGDDSEQKKKGESSSRVTYSAHKQHSDCFFLGIFAVAGIIYFESTMNDFHYASSEGILG